MTEIQKWFSELQRMIDEPYHASCAEPTASMRSDKLETHLLATPRRKTILFIDRSGDFEYDEEMTVEMEVKFALEIDQCYALLCQRMIEVYGPALNLQIQDLDLQVRTEPEDDSDDQALTNSYLSGASYDNSDDGDESYWQFGTDFVCIQKIKNWGDGNFQHNVIETVTPRETV